MPDLHQRPKITVEELVRLKRAERPDAAFWANFERELRQKQLTALLEKRSWWRDFPQMLARRAYLPLGATAVIAFTLISLRDLTPASVAAGGNRAPESTARSGPVGAAEKVVIAAAALTSPLVNQSSSPAPAAINVISANQPSAGPTEVAAAAESTIAPVASRADADSPSARSIAANLARLEQSEPELVNAVMGSRLSSPARVQTATLEESDSTAASSSRHTRLLAQYHDRVVTPDPSVAPDLVRERLARRLGDSDIYERISRLGLSGSKVSLKF